MKSTMILPTSILLSQLAPGKFSKLLLATLCLLGALSASAFAQQDTIVTTEMIGSLTGSLIVTYPSGPCAGQDNGTSTGSVHVGASVDLTTNTVDYHITLLSVKGTGTLVSKYIANGATDLLDQGYPGSNISVPIQINANVFPSGPCRAAFPQSPVFPVVVTVSFGTDFTLNTVSASVSQNLP
jgi:hypothetical protein